MGVDVTTERLDSWRDLIRENFVSLDIVADRSDPFSGHVRSEQIGLLNVASVTSGPQKFTRTAQLAQADDIAYLQVGLLQRGAAVVQQDGREAVLSPGDFALYETVRPFHWALQGTWELLVFTWPRPSFRLDEAASHNVTARCLNGSSGIGAIVGRMLADLAHSPPALSADAGTRLGHEVCELVTTVATEHVRPSEPAHRADVLGQRIDDYIFDHLSDPGLSPAEIAAAHFISTRHLHRLFAGRGTTVSQQIRQRRLERACLELRRPGSQLSITDISWRWGFPDVATFSRAFRAAYATTPTRYRTASNR